MRNNDKDWRLDDRLDFTGWENIEVPLDIELDLEDLLPANVPRPPGTMVGDAWKGSAGDYIEHWVADDESSSWPGSYYRYRADNVVPCAAALEAGSPEPGCEAVIPGYSHRVGLYQTLKGALAGASQRNVGLDYLRLAVMHQSACYDALGRAEEILNPYDGCTEPFDLTDLVLDFTCQHALMIQYGPGAFEIPDEDLEDALKTALEKRRAQQASATDRAN